MKKIILLITFAFFAHSCSEEIIAFKGKENKSISVETGKRFIIVLQENHAKGQNWRCITNNETKIAEYIKANYHGAETGDIDFVFETKGKGNTTIKFNLVEYSNVVDSCSVEVEVK